MKNLIWILIASFALCSCGGKSATSEGNDSLKMDSVSKSSKLNSEILGIKIGETSTDSALLIMKKLGSDMKQVDRDAYLNMDGIRFGGLMWDAISIQTFKQRVRSIYFMKPYTSDTLDEFTDDFEQLSSAFKEKYSSHLIEAEDSTTSAAKSYILFGDNLMTISLGLDIIGDHPALTLKYENNELEDAYDSETYDEI